MASIHLKFPPTISPSLPKPTSISLSSSSRAELASSLAMAGKGGSGRCDRLGPMLAMVVCCWAGAARGDFASDQAECADSLVGLSMCLAYVQGSSKAPTPDCCSGLKQVVGRSAKCLCVLIKDRDEPQLGFKIDVTRAMTLPTTCGNPINITQCIDLLKLPPNSKDAQVFKQFGNSSKEGNAPGKGAPSSSKPSPATGGGGSAGKPDSSGVVGINHHLRRRRWVGVEVAGGLWLSCLLLLSLLVLGD